MTAPKLKRITIPVSDEVYQILKLQSEKNQTSIAQICKKIIEQETRKEHALTAQDILLATMRKAIRLELKVTENRIANLSAKSAITSATCENISYLILKNQNQQNPSQVRDMARKRAVAYLRENLNDLINLYQGPEEGVDS